MGLSVGFRSKKNERLFYAKNSFFTSIPVYHRIGLSSCSISTLLDNRRMLYHSHITFLMLRKCALRCSSNECRHTMNSIKQRIDIQIRLVWFMDLRWCWRVNDANSLLKYFLLVNSHYQIISIVEFRSIENISTSVEPTVAIQVLLQFRIAVIDTASLSTVAVVKTALSFPIAVIDRVLSLPITLITYVLPLVRFISYNKIVEIRRVLWL